MKSVKMYFLQNVGQGYVGNSPLWWEKGNCGYTTDLNEAKHFTRAEADEVIRGTKGSHRWKKWEVGKVLSASRLVADIQDLRKA